MTRQYKYLLLVLTLLLFFGCKRHRKINVEGTVTDKYTGQLIPDAKVSLYSFISQTGKYDTDSRLYEASTNSDGKYYFKNAFFSRPGFSGNIYMKDASLFYTYPVEEIDIKDAKLIGKANLTRDIEVISYSKLNLSYNINNSYNWYNANSSIKFIGSKSVGIFDNFVGGFNYPKYGKPFILPYLVGYSDGINVIKSELTNPQGQLLMTRFDTLISQGPNTTKDYTITFN
jgi:hypothetical protein